MEIKEVKKEARQILKGRWKTAMGFSALYIIIISIINSIPGIGTLVGILFSIPLYIGMTGEFILFTNNQNVGATDFFKIGFKHFLKSWAVFFLILVKVILKFIVLMFISFFLAVITVSVFNKILGIELNEDVTTSLGIIITIILSYIAYSKYAFAKYICINTTEKSAKEILNESKMIMKGNRKQYLLLQLSFLGWYVPAIIIYIISIYMMWTGLKYLFPLLAVLFGYFPTFEKFATAGINLLIGCLLSFINYIYVSFIQPYKIIANIKFYEKINQ